MSEPTNENQRQPMIDWEADCGQVYDSAGQRIADCRYADATNATAEYIAAAPRTIARLTAENERLREALEDCLSTSVDAPAYPDGPCLEKWVRDQAKQALGVTD